ncbi:hypothetical protein EPH_0006090 [Eimeria praecox]|uniref:Uncharacterized protein n=1 Tax=Eimeria praecox TaxID=51316 RepID=U6GAX1_9EIME|nr:hypothetical protein EPH_0006090 [Eimeria praecox]
MEKELPVDAEERGLTAGNSVTPSVAAGKGELVGGDPVIDPEEEANLKREDQDVGEDAAVPPEGVSLSKGGRGVSSFGRIFALVSSLAVGIGVVMSSQQLREMLPETPLDLLPADFEKGETEPQPMPTVSLKDLMQCEEQLRSSAADFQRSWDMATPRVKEAFVKYFIPSMEDSQAPPIDPPALYIKHVNGMLGAPRPDPTDVSALQERKMNLLLLRGICAAAAGNLKRLGDLEKLYAQTHVPVPVLGLGKQIKLPPLPELMDQEDDGVTVAEFLKHFGIEVKPKGETSRVPRDVAQSLQDLLHESELLESCISEARTHFFPFFSFQGIDNEHPPHGHPNVHISHSGEQFNVNRFFCDVWFGFKHPKGKNELLGFLKDTVAGQWCTKRAADFVLQQQAFVTYFLETELGRKRAFLREAKSKGEGLDLEGLEAIARFLV